MGEEPFLICHLRVVFLRPKEMGMKREREQKTEYLYDFEPPEQWEPLRDEEGELMEGCWRTTPAVMSDEAT